MIIGLNHRFHRNFDAIIVMIFKNLFDFNTNYCDNLISPGDYHLDFRKNLFIKNQFDYYFFPLPLQKRIILIVEPKAVYSDLRFLAKEFLN